MSIYQTVETAFTDLDMLKAAIEAAGLGDQVVAYPQHDGVYRKWCGQNSVLRNNAKGAVRDRNAALVIHGGLDTWMPSRTGEQCPRTGDLRGGPGWYCGDTAFVYDEATGRYVVQIDEAHGNAHLNWVKIKDNYAALMVEQVAAKQGLRCERTTNAQGKIVLRVYPKAGTRLITQKERA